MRNKHKISKTKVNFWQDSLTFLLLLIVSLTAFTHTHLHKWLGAGMAVAVFIHLTLHWHWIVAMGRRFMKKMPYQVRFKLILNLALLLVFLLLAFSGIIVALIYAPTVTDFHNSCFYLFISLTALHLALNWGWIVNNGRRIILIGRIH